MSDPVTGGLTTLAQHEELWQKVLKRRARLECERLKPAQIRLWNGDMVLRGLVAGERGGEFEFIENDTGTAMLQLSLDHYLAKWVMNHRGREKRNVIVTFDKQGARWSGFMDHYRVVRDKGGDAYLEIIFKHDYEQTKHILCWSNPFLLAEFQFPKLWVIFGPAKWCLLMTLFVNILRLETAVWTLPDNPLDPSQYFPMSLDISNWRNMVKPFPFLGDNSNITVVFSRFQTFHDVAKRVLQDAQLTITCRRYLKDEDPHPFASLQGELNIDLVEDLFTKIPIRHGCVIWDIVDNSNWGTETAFGGSLLTGLVRAAMNIGEDGTTEGIDVYTGDATFPGEYYTPGFMGTRPMAPHVVYEEGVYTGIESSEFIYYEATDTAFVQGSKSMPGVNEGISAGINIGGDVLTSLINQSLAGLIDLPPLGGTLDAIAKPVYEDVALAFVQVPTLRASEIGQLLPIPGLEGLKTGLGAFHYFEGKADGADRAVTISGMLAVRAKIWATRAHSSHTIKVSDAAPYLIGEEGFGHFWLGNRIGTTVLGYPVPHTIFVERVSKIGYKWDKDGPKGWAITVGYREPQDPVFKAFEMIRDINGGLGDLGLL